MTHLPHVLLLAVAGGASLACSGDDDREGLLPGDPPATTLPGAWASRADSSRVLENPHKGWYHHYLDDAGTRYGERDDGDLARVPGLDHLYLRLAWSQLEPADDEYDWSLIDDAVAKYEPQGLRFAFAFTAKETAIEYATPKWVRDLGAGGTEIVGVPWDPEQRVWEPDYGDSIFVAELADFHRAVADRYAAEPWLSYVQIAAYGSWGEGHNWPATDSIYPLDVQTDIIDVYTDAYPDDVLLTITDDWVGNSDDAAFRQTLRAYIESRGITYTDHSPLVDFYVDNFPETFSIRSPELFDAVWEDRPVPIELEHYGNVRNDGNWGGPEGAGGGADLLRGIIATTHATWVSFHGYADEWLGDNPALAREIANRVGYWLFVEDASARVSGRELSVRVDWRNAGTATVYEPYALELQLAGPVGRTVPLGSAGLEGIGANGGRLASRLTRELPPDIPAGTYAARLRLVDADDTGRLVDVALRASDLDEGGLWDIGELVVP